MKTREIFLFADGILLFTILLAIFTLFISKKSSAAKEFKLPAYTNFHKITPEKKANIKFTQGNLFHPMRGATIAPSPKQSEKKSNAVSQKTIGHFELTGIFSFASIRGAVIVNKAPISDPRKIMKKNFNRIFREGDNLSEGYVVQKIGDNTVELVRGKEKLILTLQKKQEKKP